MTGCCQAPRARKVYLAGVGSELQDETIEVYSKKEGIRSISLFDLLSKTKYSFIWGFPRAFTFICPTEARSFSEHIPDFQKLDCQVLCVSTDSVHTLKAWSEASKDAGGLGETNENLVFIGDRSRSLCRALMCLDDKTGDCKRASFFVDDKKVVRYVSCIEDSVGRHVTSFLDVLASIKKKDETGKLCPANWKEGKDLI